MPKRKLLRGTLSGFPIPWAAMHNWLRMRQRDWRRDTPRPSFLLLEPKNRSTKHAASTTLQRAINLAKALLFPLLVIASAAPSSAEPRQRSVLVLYQSITTGLPAYEQISDSFRSTLETADGDPIAIYEESLDLSRFEGPAYLKIIEHYLRNKYSAIPIGAIVTIGAKAFEYALPLRSGPWASTPIIFAAVSDSSIDMPARPPNVTGLTLRSSPADYVAAARALVPQLKQVVIVGDQLPKQTFRSHFVSELPAATADLTLTDLTGLPLVEVRKRVSNLPEDSAILYTSINVDGGGQVITPRRALEALVQVANRPIVIDVATNIGTGAAGGFVVLPAEIGKGAAEMTLRILAGEDAASIPIEFQRNAVKPVFDWRQLQRFGVRESALPPGSEIRLRAQPAWQTYRWQIIAVLFAIAFQSALIVWIFVEDRYRRHAEKKAIELGTELAHISRFATAGELSASIAHEIRQPLAAIVASASACLNFLKAKEPDLATVRQAQQSIVNEGRRADHVLDNVRAMFRKESLPHEPININSIIHDVIAIVRRKLELSRIAFRTGLTTNPEPIVLGDRIQLQQVLLNVMLNAIDAMTDVTGRAHELQVRSELDDDAQVIVSIIDSGSGIDSQDMNNIFNPFFTTKSHGMGIGLSISKSIVEAHGGQLTAKKGARYGSVFEIVLPLVGDRQ